MILQVPVNVVFFPFVGQVPAGQANLDPAPEEAHSREPSSKNPSQGQKTQQTVALQLSHTHTQSSPCLVSPYSFKFKTYIILLWLII